MAESRISQFLEDDDLCGKAFSFFITFDKNLVVLDIGPSLRKLSSDLKTGGRLDDVFRILRPKIPLEAQSFIDHQIDAIVLESLKNKVR